MVVRHDHDSCSNATAIQQSCYGVGLELADSLQEEEQSHTHTCNTRDNTYTGTIRSA